MRDEKEGREKQASMITVAAALTTGSLTESSRSRLAAEEVSLRLLRGTWPQFTTSTLTLHTSPLSTPPGTPHTLTCQCMGHYHNTP